MRRLGPGLTSPRRLLPETRAHIARVKADGGTVLNPYCLDRFIRHAKLHLYYTDLAAAYSPSWGVKTGTGVAKLYSITGAGQDLAQATAANQPALVLDAVNGRPAVLFNGASHYMKTGATAVPQPFTVVFAGVNRVTFAANAAWCDGMTSLKARVMNGGSTPELKINSGVLLAGNLNLPINTLGHVRALFNGASSATQVNATASVTGDAGTNALDGFTLGARGDNSNFANIQITDVIILRSAVDGGYAAKMDAIQQFEKQAYGTP